MNLPARTSFREPKSRVLGTATAALVTCLVLLSAGAPAQAQNWKLSWNDEFNSPAGTLPDAGKWTYDTGAGGWGNHELETYCAPGSNTPPCDAAHPNAFEDGQGHLVLEAKRRNGTWTSARLKTQNTRSFLYGRVEARMKLPVGAGFWPAFWMLGDNIAAKPWPACGEQDIMEWVQSYGPTTTSSTIHGPGYSGKKGISHTFSFPSGGRVDDGFHTYGVVWSPDRLQFYRDDPAKPFITLTPADLPPGTQWAYNHPFFLLLNFAIGSQGFAGATNKSTPQSARVLVDYVRVYQQAP